jgi:hypothetical protein
MRHRVYKVLTEEGNKTRPRLGVTYRKLRQSNLPTLNSR